MIGFRTHSRIAVSAVVLFSFLNMALAAAFEFSPIAQAQVENEGCEEFGNGAPLIITARNDPAEVQTGGVVKTTIEFRPVDGDLRFQRYTKYSNTNGEGTYTGKVKNVPTKYAKAGEVMHSVKFGTPGTYQHIIVLRIEDCESKVTLPTISVR